MVEGKELFSQEQHYRGLKWLMNMTGEGVATMTAEDWEGYCWHVED
jgi:hypothetical protein